MAYDPLTSHRDEWMWWPNREAATLRSVGPIGTYTAHALSTTHPRTGAPEPNVAKRRAPATREKAPSAGAYTGQTTGWLVPSVAWPTGVTPKPGDQLRDAAAVDHTVLEVRTGKFGLTYHLTTVALALVNGLASTGSLYRPNNARDAAGRAALTAYAVVAAGVACRVQPQDADAGEVFDRVTTPRRFTAYLGEQLAARAKDVFEAGGVRYTVEGYRSPDRLDQLPELALEAVA